MLRAALLTQLRALIPHEALPYLLQNLEGVMLEGGRGGR